MNSYITPNVRAPPMTFHKDAFQQTNSHCAYERGKENQMITFQIQNNDGALSSVSHDRFFEILNGGYGYLYYKQGGTHLAMLPTAENEETIRICRQSDYAERDADVINTRCRDDKGQPCRYQHDENGRVLRNEKGYAIRAKCGNCPRDGWKIGERKNCCLCNYCKAPDCTYCPNLREYSIPISFEWLTEDKRDNSETGGAGFNLADPNADIQATLENDELNSTLLNAIGRLPLEEQAVIKAIYWNNLSRRAFSIESGIAATTVKRIHDRALMSLKKIMKDFY